jgi:RimJ/RimL family protein N-acetyltransferase
MRFTALDEKEPVGFFTVRNPKDTMDELRIGFVLLDPRKRGKGYGKAMLQLGLKYAFEIYGAETVSLGVFENNAPAYGCYYAAGFRETGTREAYTVNGQQWVAVDMECRKAE